MAAAVLDILGSYGKLEGPISLRQVRRKVNAGGLDTVARALHRLAPWFLARVEEEDVDGTGAGCPARVKARVYKAREAEDKPYSPRYCKTGVFQRRPKALLPAAGRTGIFVIDALVEAAGSLAQAALVGRGGRSRYTVRRAVARLEELELVTVADGTLTLAPAWQALIDEQVVLMPTHGNGGRRIVAEAWRLLASCHVAKERARRTRELVPEWVRKREIRAWADLERYGIGQDDDWVRSTWCCAYGRDRGGLAAAPNVGVRSTRE